jgi:activator of HSP90 ATPase
METQSINQTVLFNAQPIEVYELIMDEKKHAAFTGSEVRMSKEPNGTFSIFDGYCHGYNIELMEGQKIVQAWHFEENGWPDDHFSICTFIFENAGDKTKLIFEQTDVPVHKADELKKGWNDFYWEPMKSLLEGNTI